MQRNRRAIAGFSQVELLVMLFIVGLMAGVVVLTLPGGGRGQLEQEARDFAADLRRAAQESILTGEPMGVSVGVDGYRFWRRAQGDWRALDGSRYFGERRWGDGTELAAMETAPGRPRRVAGAQKAGPELRFEPIGLASPFRIVLAADSDGARETERYVISGDETGAITVEAENGF